MKIVAISDTHGQHRQLTQAEIPEGDVLIHAGDFTRHGDIHELEDFLDWFKDFPHEHKIFIAGNHDLCMQNHENEDLPINQRKKERIDELLKQYWYDHQIIYLHNSGKTIDGVTFFGSPYSNTLPGWAFNTDKEKNDGVWEYMFEDTDVLITHGPPHGENDYINDEWGRIGDKELKKRREEVNDLDYHFYGHNHGSHGKAEGKPWSINVSMLDNDYNFSDNAIKVTL